MSEVIKEPVQITTEYDGEVYELVAKQYKNGANHMYGIDDRGRMVHVSHLEVLEAYGYGKEDLTARKKETAAYKKATALATADEVKAPAIAKTHLVPGGGKKLAGIESDDILPEAQKGRMGKIAARIGSVARRGAEGAKNGWEKLTLKGRLALGATALVGMGLFAGMLPDNPDAGGPRIDTMEAAAPGVTPATELANSTKPEAKSKGAAAAEAEQEKLTAALNAAVEAKLSAIGLEQGQYREITDENAALPGAIEANHFSMNHGPEAWNGRERTIKGSKQMGQDLLSGKNGFDATSAKVSQDALRHFNVPQNVIDQLAGGKYNEMAIKAFVTDSPVYKNMTFNRNGVLAIEELRTGVGNEDVFFVISYKNGDKVEAVATRGDCGGVGPQPFEAIVVKKAPAPQRQVTPTPQSPVTTAPPTVETTTPPTTKVTTPPTTKVTTPPTTKVTTPPTTKVTTPPTTSVPKHDDGELPGSGVPADQDKGTPDKAGKGPAGQQPNPDGYVPGEDKPATPPRKETPVVDKPKDNGDAEPNPSQPQAPSAPATPGPVAPNPGTQPTKPE